MAPQPVIAVQFVLEAVRLELETATELATGLGDAPAPPAGEASAVPYYVVDWIPGGSVSGSWGAPAEQGAIVLQVTAAGRTLWQAAAMLDRARAVLLGRTAGGQWAHPIIVRDDAGDPARQQVIGRRSDGLGGGSPTGTVVSTAERFVLEVQAT